IAYHERLVLIAAADVLAPDPTALQPRVSAALSDLAAAALDACAAIARAAVTGHGQVRWAVIALGKSGAWELNFLSDVDAMHVIAPASENDGGEADPGGEGDADGRRGEDGEVDEEEMVALGSALARELARAASDRTGEGSLWQVDANLRPEGKDGPLVRTLDSYRRYYDQWAH